MKKTTLKQWREFQEYLAGMRQDIISSKEYKQCDKIIRKNLFPKRNFLWWTWTGTPRLHEIQEANWQYLYQGWLLSKVPDETYENFLTWMNEKAHKDIPPTL